MCLYQFLTLTLVTLALTQPAISQCHDEDFVLGDSTSSIAIQGRSYTPRCLKILAGSSVTIVASKRHPLSPQTGNLKNPIHPTETTESFVFHQPGHFGYFCTDHGSPDGRGMAGEILVVEE